MQYLIVVLLEFFYAELFYGIMEGFMKTLLTSKIFLIIMSSVFVVGAVVTAVIVVNSKDVYRLLKVFEVNGSAVVARNTVGDIDAYQGMNLESGDNVSVDTSSYMRIKADEDKYILAEPGTDFDIEAYGNEKANKTVINLRSGAILNEINTKLSPDSTYEINTPKATMAVRGTSYRIAVEKGEDGNIYILIQTFDGAVEVQLYDENGNPKGDSVTVPANSSAAIKVENNPDGSSDPTVDGIANFILDDETGSYLFKIDSDMVPQIVAKTLLDSYENGNRPFNDEILDILNGASDDSSAQPGRTNISFNSSSNTNDNENNNGTEAPAELTTPENTPIQNTSNGSQNSQTGSLYESSTENKENDKPAETKPPVKETSKETETAVSSSNSAAETTIPETELETKPETTTAKKTETSPRTTTMPRYYTVRFLVDNNVYSTQSVVEGGYAYPPQQNPYKEGYVFKGWDNSIYRPVYGNLDITAIFERNYYTVTFIGFDGSVISTQQVETGKAASAPTAPTVDGYIFTGWDIGFSNVQTDLTVRAIYIQNTYTVTFIDEYHNTTTTLKGVPKGTDLAGYSGIPGNPSALIGNDITWGTFKGWAGRTVDADFHNVKGNITLYAEYNKRLPVRYVVEIIGRESLGTDGEGNMQYNETTLGYKVVEQIDVISVGGWINLPEIDLDPDSDLDTGNTPSYDYEVNMDSSEFDGIQVTDAMWNQYYTRGTPFTLKFKYYKDLH
jgi:hypothetical protein